MDYLWKYLNSVRQLNSEIVRKSLLYDAIFGMLNIDYICQAKAGLQSIEAAEYSAGLPF